MLKINGILASRGALWGVYLGSLLFWYPRSAILPVLWIDHYSKCTYLTFGALWYKLHVLLGHKMCPFCINMHYNVWLFRYVLLGFVSVSFLRDNMMRNRAQTRPLILTLIYYEGTMRKYLTYFRDSFDINPGTSLLFQVVHHTPSPGMSYNRTNSTSDLLYII